MKMVIRIAVLAFIILSVLMIANLIMNYSSLSQEQRIARVCFSVFLILANAHYIYRYGELFIKSTKQNDSMNQ